MFVSAERKTDACVHFRSWQYESDFLFLGEMQILHGKIASDKDCFVLFALQSGVLCDNSRDGNGVGADA